MKTLVIGGTGMLSGPVALLLRQRGADVAIFHRGNTPAGEGLSELLGDRSDYPAFVQAVRSAGPWDCILEMIGGNVGDAGSLIEAVAGTSPHIIFCSTTTVYGRPFAKVPVTEDAALLPPSPYGVNKLACEQALRSAEARGAFALTIVRPAHIYNERTPILHSLGTRSSHLDRLLHGRPIVVHDDGEGLWSCLWTSDAAAAITEAAFSPAAPGRTYHLADSEVFSWKVYHHMLASGLGAPYPDIRPIPSETLARLAPDRTLQCLRTLRFPGVYDCTAARTDLNFRPTVGPAEGLARAVTYRKDQGLIEPWSSDEEYERIAFSIELAI